MLYVYAVLLSISSAIVFLLLPTIDVEITKDLIISLLEDTVSVSSFVFAVTGVWLAIANPRVMSELFRKGYSSKVTADEKGKFSLIFFPLKYSIANICLSVAILTVVRISSAINTNNEALVSIGKKILMSLTLMTNFVVILAILFTVLPAYIIQKNSSTAGKKNETFRQQTSNKKINTRKK